MQLYNLKHPAQQVSFVEALQLGLGIDRGLFFPTQIPKLENIEQVLAMPFVARSQLIMRAWLGDELPAAVIDELVANAFNFDVPVKQVDKQRYVLELFHGPTLAFKDFGARFMAQCLAYVNQQQTTDKPLTILTATSGDTGAAVAEAFYGLEQVKVVILYPKGKISLLQEKMFATLGQNIQTLAIEGDFDACQDLVKTAFEDQPLKETLGLNSANSINISRLLAQICYYFEAVAQFIQNEQQADKSHQPQAPVISVPSGNFGNLTAGMLAKAMGLPVKRFIAATNENDTVPRFLSSGLWQVEPTKATLSNAMDVSDPSNWPRLAQVCQQQHYGAESLVGMKVDDQITVASVKVLQQFDYLSEPHTALAAYALEKQLRSDEKGIFLATAHPAKFKSVVEDIIGQELPLPPALVAVADKAILSQTLPAAFAPLKQHLLELHEGSIKEA